VKRLAIVLALVLTLAACGMSKHKSTTGNTAAAQAEIKSAYANFFSSKSSVSKRASLLQEGSKFEPLIRTFASNPLASNVSATVSSVMLEGKNKARVVYVVKFGGASLPKQTGTAVRENGSWKVGNASLCKLIALGGTTPSACKS
jgi:hypothetical protein